MHREIVTFTEVSKPDAGEKKKIKIFQGGNGDYYLSVCPCNHNGGDTIRIETSGGASTRNPRLLKAISLLYLAVAEEEEAFDSAMKGPDIEMYTIENLLENFSDIKDVANSHSEEEKLGREFIKNFKKEYRIIEK